MPNRTYGNFKDLLNFTRASFGTCYQPISYGPEKEISFATGWTDNGDGSYTKSAAGFAQVGILGTSEDVGKIYNITFTVDSVTSSDSENNFNVYQRNEYNTGNLSYSPSKVKAGQTITYNIDVLSDGGETNRIVFIDSYGFKGTISNVKIRELSLLDEGIPSLVELPRKIPRLNYDPEGNLRGVLLEQTLSQLNPYCFAFEERWTADGTASATDNAGLSPQGIMNASKLDYGSNGNSGGPNRVSLGISSGFNAGYPFTFSVFVKNIDAKGINLRAYCAGSTTVDAYADFNLADGDVTNSSGGVDHTYAEKLADGWWRFAVTFTTHSSTTSINMRIGQPLSGSAGEYAQEGVYIFGAQLEGGDNPTSLIITNSTAASRSADIAQIDIADAGMNQTGEGTVICEVTDYVWKGTGYPRFFEFGSDTTSDNRVLAFVASGNTNASTGFNSKGASQAGITLLNADQHSAFEFGLNLKIGFSWKENSIHAAVNGVGRGEDTSASMMPSKMRDELKIAGATSGGNNLNSSTRSIQYYPYKMDYQDMIDLTDFEEESTLELKFDNKNISTLLRGIHK